MATPAARHGVVVASRRRSAEQVLELAADGTTVLLCGPSGSGRTTVAELAAAAHTAAVVSGGGLAGLRHVPMLALSRALRLAVPPGDTTRAARFVLAASGRATLIVLDDLHLCDPETVEVVVALVGQVPLILTVADDQPTGRRLAAQVAAVPGVARVDLGPLRDDEGAALAAEHLVGRTSPGAIDEVVLRAGGNLAALIAIAREPTAETYRAAVANRLATLAPSSRTVLCLIGLLGRPAPVALVGERAAADAVDDGVVTVAHGEVVARSRLDVDVAIARCPAAIRAELHRWVAARVADAEAVRHLEAAGDPAGALERARRAQATASSPAEVVRFRAIIARLSDGERRDERCLDVAIAASDIGDHRLARSLSELADRPDEPRSLLVAARGRLAAGEIDAALDVLARSDGWPDERLRLWASIERARALCLRDPFEALEVAGAAYDGAVDGTDQARAAATLGAAQLAAGVDGWEQTLALASERAHAEGMADVAFAADANRCSGLLRFARATEARHLATACAEGAREAGADHWASRFEALVLWVTLHVYADLREALAIGEPLLDTALSPPLRSEVRAQVALAHGDGGCPEVARSILGEAASADELAGWCAAELDALIGDHAGAQQKASAVVAGSTRWPIGAFAAVTAAWAATNTGTPVVPGAAVDAAGGAAAELAALAMGPEAERAVMLFRDAAVRWEPLSRRSVLRCRAAAAVASASRDHDGAMDALRQVSADAKDAGLDAFAAQLHRARRRLGDPDARRGPTGPRDALLSRRESEVIALVGDGLTSVAIAGRLNVAPSTVETHVKSAMRKLGASTRTEAAVLATRARP